MNGKKGLSRRDFIKFTTLSAVAVSIPTAGLGLFEGCTSKVQNPVNYYFTLKEIKMMEAISDQIIPKDEWAGGREAGVVNFIDLQLTGPYHRFQADYRKGLNAIQNTCESKLKFKFENLSYDKQTEFLQKMEAGKTGGDAWSKGFDKYFFELLRSHCLQGYYGSPRHGGNKNFISFAMIGLDQPAIIGENRDGI